MYSYMKGEVTEIAQDMLVLEVGGIGYAIEASRWTLDQLSLGKAEKLYLRQMIKEDEHVLCGFIEEQERRIFDHLVSVSGIGRKVAMGMLSKASYDKLLEWLITGDEKQLTALPGLGKKTAQRLIVELRDKLKKMYGTEFKGSNEPLVVASPVQEDVYLALSGLGFKREEIALMLQGIDVASLSVESAIKFALTKRF